MPPTQPSHLKLHTEAPSPPPIADSVRDAARIAESLTEATGWRFTFRDAQTGQSESVDPGWEPTTAGRFVVASPLDKQAASLAVAEQVATSVSSLVEQLNATQHALWQREAELAAGVPVVAKQEDSAHLAARLQAAIRGGAEAIGCDAGAAYIMNDATSHLKLRSAWGLPADRLTGPHRELRGSIADLEALIGHAVVIEDANEDLPWRSPESQFGSAVCVPISTPSTPLGTLWMFCHEPRPFTDRETQIVELVAGRVAAELEREMLISQETAATQIQKQLLTAGDWFARRLPQITPLTSQWQFAGGRLEETPGGDFFDWSVRHDGRLTCAIGDCPGHNIEALLESAAFKSAYQSLLAVESRPGRLLRLLNESLWNASPGGAAGSIFYASIDEDTGLMEYASAGEPVVVALRDTKFRGLIHPTTPLGSDPDSEIHPRRRRVAPDETLVMLSESARHLPLRDGRQLDEAMVAKAVGSLGTADADEIQERLRGWLLDHTDGAAERTSLMVLRRRPPRI